MSSDSRPVEVVAHDVDEVQRLRHGRHVVRLVDRLPSSRDCGGQDESVLVELGTHLAEELGVVLAILREARAIVSAS